MIAIIDYGMGNLRSVQKALEVVGAKTKIVSKPTGLKSCEKIVFPGVGAFGDAMRELRLSGLDEAIRGSIKKGKPFLGLCLGLQLLFEKSEEAPRVKGLGILKGEVEKFCFSKNEKRATNDVLKVPHMGWNSIVNSRSSIVNKNRLLKAIPKGSHFYFVHSYYVKPKDRKSVIAETDYGIRFVSGVCKDNVFGLQFHPEKSQGLGLKILKNFISLKS